MLRGGCERKSADVKLLWRPTRRSNKEDFTRALHFLCTLRGVLSLFPQPPIHEGCKTRPSSSLKAVSGYYPHAPRWVWSVEIIRHHFTLRLLGLLHSACYSRHLLARFPVNHLSADKSPCRSRIIFLHVFLLSRFLVSVKPFTRDVRKRRRVQSSWTSPTPLSPFIPAQWYLKSAKFEGYMASLR